MSFLSNKHCYINDLTPFEIVEFMQEILIKRATGVEGDFAQDYKNLRSHLMSRNSEYKYLPQFISNNFQLEQFWEFIKIKFESYAERRLFLYESFKAQLLFLEANPLVLNGSEIDFKQYGTHEVSCHWNKATERLSYDPEGAITLARTLLESVCKRVLHDKNIESDDCKADISRLYKKVSVELNMSPDQHTEKVFKQILNGCTSVVQGLGSLRNKLGDAHAQEPLKAKPKKRHAALAVNLAGSMAMFLIETHLEAS